MTTEGDQRRNMINFLKIKQIEGALQKTRIVMEDQTIQVDSLQVKITQEKAVREATTEEREEHRVETEEVQKVRLKEEDFLRKLNVSAAEAQITKLWNVEDLKNIVAPDARIVDSSTKPRTAIKEDPTINLPKEMEKEGTRGKVWTKEEKESMQWKLKRLLILLYL